MRRFSASNKWVRGLAKLALSIVVLCFATHFAFGQGMNPPRSNDAPPQTASTESAAKKYFTDVVLVNQNGEKMKFYSDLLEGKVVIINSFFATCAGSCLPLNRNLEKLQQNLGARMGKDVHIISISV